MAYCNDDPRLTIQESRELGYCENCDGCRPDIEEDLEEDNEHD